MSTVTTMSAASTGTQTKEIVGLVVAVVACAVVLLMPTPEGLGPMGQRMAALFALILILWSTEALPIAITSLLALVFQPILGLNDLNTAFQNFIGLVFFFVLIMFIVALAWVKTGLAHRFALALIARAGTESRRVIYVFTIGTGLLSLVVSDVPTCAIFMAVAIGILEKLNLEPGKSQFAKALMLGIPIGALVGGVGTIAGSSINVLGLQIIQDNGGPSISFLQWMAIGIPMVVILLPLSAFIIARAFTPEIDDIGDIDDVRKELRALGPLTGPERKVVIIQALMLIFWIAGTWVPAFNVVTVGVFGATAMFVPGIRLFTWREAQQATGWDILMMAGAVATLGAASTSSGLAQWLVDVSLGGMSDFPVVVVLALISIFTVLIHLMLPVSPVINAIMIPPIMLLAVQAGVNPALYALPVVFTASCAMLIPLDPVPLLTFSKGYYTMFEMFKPGALISIVWVIVMTAILLIVGPAIGLM
jgi:sodium-dependent dicarboxylate transporter 2/3/5